jgi:hypothetical protein
VLAKSRFKEIVSCRYSLVSGPEACGSSFESLDYLTKS